MITTKQLKDKYLKFFSAKGGSASGGGGHKIIPSASLIPENDPTVLFTTAGMHPLVPYLLGEKHPAGDKLVNVQKCIRTSDIDEVGDDWHLTFFEMLGNWGLGSYWKKEAIEMSLEFLTKELGLPIEKLAVSCFKGDNNVLKDEESAKVWQSVGIPKNRIYFFGREDNFWGPAGKMGPCGPCTEIFYWTGKGEPPDLVTSDNKEGWVEIWNDVFMEYNRRERTILIDGMDCLYDEEFRVNQKLLDILNKIQARKILVINAFGEKAEKLVGQYGIEVFTFEKKIVKENKKFFEKLFEKYDLKPEEVVYFDHLKENLEGAKDAGIKLIKQFSNNEEKINEFIDKNIFYYIPLKQRNVDTGMGVERTVAILNGAASVYETSESLMKIIEEIEKLSGKEYSRPKLIKGTPFGSNEQVFTPNVENGGGRTYDKEMRIIADHLRAATFIMGDEKGIIPSNVEQGYVVRKLIRRAINEGKKIGIKKSFTHEIGELIIDLMGDEYSELKKNRDFIIEQLAREEEKFKEALMKVERRKEKRLNIINRLMGGRPDEGDKKWIISDTNTASINIDIGKLTNEEEILDTSSRYGASASFVLETRYGYPHNLFIDDLKERKIINNKYWFENAEKLFAQSYLKHKELSRTATAGKFKSGLADNSEQVTKLHTATHLLLAALRKVLGNHVFQKGSNITAERLRLDFSHSEKMTAEELKKVEDIVNEQIKNDLPVCCEEMPLEEAKKKDAMGVFESKYKDRVKVYSVENFSCEICSGPHAQKTGELGHFKIIKEEASSAGVRRIKAILE